MHTWVLELNDSALLLGDGRSPALRSPGYATVTRHEVITGDAAQARARGEPRHTLNQFWLRLGTEALHDARSHARHHADLAWAHLQQLAASAGNPQRMILAVPGSFSREQLGVLLGIAQRTSFRAVGLTDSALSAASTVALGGEALHLDLQLHQCVLTRISQDGDMLTRENVRSLPGCGLVQLYELWAQLLTRLFIRHSRFDPMHAAASEQQLYDHIPPWIGALHDGDDVSVELRSAGTSYHAKLRAREVLDAAQPVYTQIEEAVRSELAGANLLASARFAALPRIEGALPAFTRLDPEAAIRGCLRHEALICSDDEALRFVTRLPAHGKTSGSADPGGEHSDAVHEAPDDAPSVATPAVPSHLVIGERALRLEPGSLYLHRDRNGWTLSRRMPHTFAGTLRWEGSEWVLAPVSGATLRLDGRPVRSPSPIRAGQHLQPDSGDEVLQLVAESTIGSDGA